MTPRLAALLLGLVPLLLPPPQDATPFDAKGYPPEMAPLAKLTALRCSKCHALDRVLGSRIRGDAWEPEVFTMMAKEKSGISEQEAEDISRFLAAWSTHKKADEAAPVLPRRRHVVASEVQVAAEDTLPKPILLEGRRFVLESVTLREEGGVAARLTEGDRVHEVALVPGADGVPVRRTSVVSTWSVGRHGFALEIGISRKEAATKGGERPAFTLAALVSRRP